MRIGIGLPTSTPGAGGELLVAWARRADEHFSSLATIDRLAYPCLDPVTSLAAAASVTSRARLATTILVAPLRNPALLLQQVTTLDELSGNRLVLGLGIGARHDDYTAAGVDPRRRGHELSSILAGLRSARPERPLLVGGGSGAAFARAARFADGYVHGGGPPRAFAGAAAQVRAAWAEMGRPGRPQLWGQAYFTLGDAKTLERGRAYLLDYYRFTGGFEERIAAAALESATAVRDFVRAYEDEGCDELVIFPTVASLDQVDRLAEVVAAL